MIKQRRWPAYVYYARWTRQSERLINVKGYWTEELSLINRRFWDWRDKNTFSENSQEAQLENQRSQEVYNRKVYLWEETNTSRI